MKWVKSKMRERERERWEKERRRQERWRRHHDLLGGHEYPARELRTVLQVGPMQLRLKKTK